MQKMTSVREEQLRSAFATSLVAKLNGAFRSSIVEWPGLCAKRRTRKDCCVEKNREWNEHGCFALNMQIDRVSA